MAGCNPALNHAANPLDRVPETCKLRARMARKDRSWMACGAVPLLAALAGAGCAAGTHATDPVPVPEDRAQARATADAEAASQASQEVKDLERRLFLRDEGKLLALALRAHGGYDRWLLLERISYTRVRSQRAGPADGEGLPAPSASGSGPPPPDPEPPAERLRIALERPRFHARERRPADPSPAGLEVLDLDDEWTILDLPFLLVDEGLRKEYLGVEHDIATGEFLEKLRVIREGSPADAWIVVSFDRSSHIMRRVLWKKAGGALSLTLFSDWREVAGLRIPARRDTYFLDGPHSHWDASKPDRTDRLEDLSTDP
jgi:hypothetical protein